MQKNATNAKNAKTAKNAKNEMNAKLSSYKDVKNAEIVIKQRMKRVQKV